MTDRNETALPLDDLPSEVVKVLATYESMVMGTLARLPNHWHNYRDPLEIGPGVRDARRVGREALDRYLNG